jgi:hypothetical protein
MTSAWGDDMIDMDRDDAHEKTISTIPDKQIIAELLTLEKAFTKDGQRQCAAICRDAAARLQTEREKFDLLGIRLADAYIRGAMWYRENHDARGVDVFSFLRKAGFDYADKTTAALSATPIKEDAKGGDGEVERLRAAWDNDLEEEIMDAIDEYRESIPGDKSGPHAWPTVDGIKDAVRKGIASTLTRELTEAKP